MRFRDLLKDNISNYEQKLENVLLYVDFLDHPLPVVLLKDGSLLILFEITGVDYEGLSEEDKQQFTAGRLWNNCPTKARDSCSRTCWSGILLKPFL